METAIYIKDGLTQIVLTPQSDFEKQALQTLKKTDLETVIMEGSFYACAGGWYRQKGDDTSIIIVAQQKYNN